MYTENEIWIQASPARVFTLAAEVAHWPSFLPHYRWVRVLEADEDQCTVEMAARRSFIPVRWTARQHLLPGQGRILYRHIGGVTVGMEVEWRLTPQNEGTHVLIVHELRPRHWLLRTRLTAWIAGSFFVKGIAARTLSHLKLTAERGVNESERYGEDAARVSRSA